MLNSNNQLSLKILNSLNKHSTNISNDIKKISSRKMIYNASDGAAEYSIAKKMEVKIRALDQDVENVNKGKTLLSIAEGGIQDAINLLKELKELAINSANDHNTDYDRSIIEKDLKSHIEGIIEIAATTNYNGRLLLNGDWADIDLANKGNGISSSPYNPYVNEPSDSGILTPNGNYTISSDGTYILPASYTGDIIITATNVKLISNQAYNSISDFIFDTHIECVSSNTNLWIENLIINNSRLLDVVDKPTISFTGSGNTLNICGVNNLIGQMHNSAVIDIGDGLEIYESERVIGNSGNRLTAGGYMDVRSADPSIPILSHYYGAIIGKSMGDTTSGTLTINGGNIYTDHHYYLDTSTRTVVASDWGVHGADIGSGFGGSIGGIIINGGYVSTHGSYGAGIGAGENSVVTGDIVINGGTVRASTFSHRENYNFVGPGIGAGRNGTVGNIVINGGKITADSHALGAGIGVAGGSNGSSQCGSIAINGGNVYALSNGGEAVGKGGKLDSVSVPYGTYHTPTNLVGNVGMININGAVYSEAWSDNDGVKYHVMRTNTGNAYELDEFHGKPLIIHTGTKSNEHLRVYIKSMHPIAMKINDISVSTKEKARNALEKLDNAINYSLNEITRIGAYKGRLDKHQDLLIINNENTVASQSTISDADIAKQIMTLKRDSILQQATQFILAQANQNSSSVLKLLQ